VGAAPGYGWLSVGVASPFFNTQIAVRPDVALAQAVRTMVHEFAHALLHGDGVTRTREIEEARSLCHQDLCTRGRIRTAPTRSRRATSKEGR